MTTPAASDPALEPALEPVPLRRLLASPWVLVVFALGWIPRIWVLLTPIGYLIADEAYTGLQAAEILTGRFPVVIAAITYTAPIESYLFAPFVAVFGLHVVPLKLVSSIGWAVAAVLTVGATRRLADDATARLAGAMIWLAPGALAVLTTRAYQGYSVGLAVMAGMIWIALVVVQSGPSLRPRESAVAGFLIGFAVYVHPMFLAVALPVAIAATWTHRARLRTWWLPAVIAAVVANVPFLVWNAKNGWPSLRQPAEETDGPVARFVGFFTDLLPRTLGLRALDGDWVFGVVVGVAVYAAVVAVGALGVRRLLRQRRDGGLVVLAPLIASWVLMAGFTNLSMVTDGRYGIINLPVVVITLALGVQEIARQLASDREWRPRLPAASALVVWMGVLTIPWLVVEAGTEFGDPNDRPTAIVELLRERGFDRVAGTYWEVVPVELISDQEIRAAISGHPFVILIPSTQRLVEATPSEDLAFVFLGPAPPPLLRYPIDEYELIVVGPTHVYLPIAARS